MIPIRDDNPHFLTPYATYAIVALNVLAWVLVQGLGTRARAVAVGLHARPGARRAAAHGARRRAGAGGSGHVLCRHRYVELALRADAHVHARQLDAHHRQHVVPLDLRQQRRGLHGPRAFRRLLSALRLCCRRVTDMGEPRVGHPDGRGVGRDRRRDGRLRPALPARQRAHAVLVRLLRDHHRHSGDLDDGLLVPGAADRRAGLARRVRAAAWRSGRTSAASWPAPCWCWYSATPSCWRVIRTTAGGIALPARTAASGK